MIRTGWRRAACTVALAASAAGCGSLDVPNLNAPDRERALASGGDVVNLVGGAFYNWYFANQYYSPAFATATMADHYTASWGNWGMRNYSSEPRIAFVNSSTDSNREVVEWPWYQNYAALVSSNLALLALDAGVEIGTGGADNKMVEVASKFMQGATLSYIALFFDQGYAIDETTDPDAIALEGRAAVQAAALAKLDEVIAAAGSNAFKLPNTFLNFDGWTNIQLAKVANTLAARTIAYYGRNSAENTAANWAKVVAYAREGISKAPGFDPSIEGNNDNWWDGYKAIGSEYSTWVRVDQRVVCMMDPTQPCRYPNTGSLPPAGGPDSRMTGAGVTRADYLYQSAIPHNPARGIYHFSHIGHQRYDYTSDTQPGAYLGTLPFIIQAENDLLLAEGLIRSNGSKIEAATLINKTRVGRGKLGALTGAESNQVLLDAIFYERDIELMGSSGNVPFYDMRRTDRIQAGTPRHFPVPAKELEVIGEAIYTFGGSGPALAPGGFAGAPGVDGRIVGPGRINAIAEQYRIDKINRRTRTTAR